MNKVNEQKVLSSPMPGPHKNVLWFCVIMLLGPMVLFLLAFVASWPLGPKYVDEGSITKLRLAIAALAFGQLYLTVCIGLLWAVVISQLRRLTGECGKLAEKQPQENKMADTTENVPESRPSNLLGYLLFCVNSIALLFSIRTLVWGAANLYSCMGAMNGILAVPILFVQLFILLPLTIIFTRRKRTVPLMLKRLIRLTLTLGIAANITLNVICIIYARLHGIRFFNEFF